jgi:diguanylate cyclase (GGDEF)-like protein
MPQFEYMLGLCLAVGAAVVLVVLYRQSREGALLRWGGVFGLLGACFALPLIFAGLAWPAARGVSDALVLVVAVQVCALVWPWSRRAPFARWQAALTLLAIAWGGAWVLATRASVRFVSPLFGAGLLFTFAAVLFARADARKHLGHRLLAAACLLMAVFSAVTAAAGSAPYLQAGSIAGLCGLLLLAIGAVVAVHGAQEARIADHSLALSSLTFGRGASAEDLRQMLDQVLERILGICEIEQGILCAVGTERQSVCQVVRGFRPEFSERWEQGRGPKKALALLERMGGLMVLRDLGRPARAGRLESDTDYQGLRELLGTEVGQGLLGLSLRTKSSVRGFLILPQPQNGGFSAASLQLLATFAAQLALAVENFLVMNEAHRRSEELRLLNQIGQAVSSTLNADELLHVLHQEVRKLLDARNFYIALCDEERGEISFELEMEDGVYLPKRRRQPTNALTEFVLESGRPLLLKHGSSEFRAEHGMSSTGPPSRCWLGVPILLHNRAIGVMAVQSTEREEAYDEAHVEVLKTLAAQAAIALENSRLFGAERRRHQHLSFLNHVARIATSTMNSDEMLVEIAGEIQRNLEYDHISIGLLDYETKDIEVKAVGGLEPGVVGRRIPLGAGILGRVAHSGQMALESALPPGLAGETLLENARSVFCLPITYGRQALGVLNVESSHEYAFPAEDVILLRTLADQLAAALHNALVFRRLQQQAITDGLTGLKTRRFFDEALQGEWKRSLRSMRSFSLILMDLDHFKPVNDRLGHLEGDLVLVRLGKILEQRCRRSNVVARYGGDEFIILMPEAGTEQAHILAERLRLWISEDPAMSVHGLTASFGLATYPLHGNSTAEMIQAADAGMYLAKSRGGNNVAVAERKAALPARDSERRMVYAIRALAGELVTGPAALEHLAEDIEGVYALAGDSTADFEQGMTEALVALADALGRKLYGPSAYTRTLGFNAMRVAAVLGLSGREQEAIRAAGALHDLGFLALPEAAFQAGPFDADEKQAVEQHVQAGARLLTAARAHPDVVQVLRHHHEFFDGSGYPDGLQGRTIPIGARILAVVDVFDMETRREAPGVEAKTRAVERLKALAGSRLDLAVVRAFISVLGSWDQAIA